MVQPKTFPPSARGATCNPEFPNLRFFMVGFPFSRPCLRFSSAERQIRHPPGWMWLGALRCLAGGCFLVGILLLIDTYSLCPIDSPRAAKYSQGVPRFFPAHCGFFVIPAERKC